MTNVEHERPLKKFENRELQALFYEDNAIVNKWLICIKYDMKHDQI